MEPYRIKVIEPLNIVTKKLRKKILIQTGYNPFLIPAEYVTIDLISDSGTGAMSAQQWAEMVQAREAFSGSCAYYKFVKMAKDITKFPFIQPVHQGRPAENILFKIILKPGDVVLSNAHFETTRANVESLGCRAIDISKPEPPFFGNIDIARLNEILNRSKNVKMVILTMTNNTNGGQPVSLDNIMKTRQLTKKYNILLVFDACRFADNVYLIKEYLRSKWSMKSLCQRIFKLGDILYLSNKKDGLVNIGGFIGVRNKKIYDQLALEIIQQESYPSAGGLAARDLAAMTIGLKDSLNEGFLRSHIQSVRYLGQTLKKNGVRIFEPIGGHAVVVIPNDDFPYVAFSLASEIYLKTGIRVGIFENSVRLALPRRVYTKDQLKYVGEAIGKIYRQKLPKLKLINKPKHFFNFFARFKKD